MSIGLYKKKSGARANIAHTGVRCSRIPRIPKLPAGIKPDTALATAHQRQHIKPLLLFETHREISISGRLRRKKTRSKRTPQRGIGGSYYGSRLPRTGATRGSCAHAARWESGSAYLVQEVKYQWLCDSCKSKTVYCKLAAVFDVMLINRSTSP